MSLKEPIDLDEVLKKVFEGDEPEFKLSENDLKDVFVQSISRALEPFWESAEAQRGYVEFLRDLALKLKYVPLAKIVTPNAAIAGPIFSGLRYSVQDADTRELYLALLATAMNGETAHEAHPAFVDMIRQMTGDEIALARHLCAGHKFCPIITVRLLQDGVGTLVVLRNFSLIGLEAGCSHPELAPAYLDNLGRLNLLEVQSSKEYADRQVYKGLENHPQIVDLIRAIDRNAEQQAILERGLVRVTSLGLLFHKTCLGSSHNGPVLLTESSAN